METKVWSQLRLSEDELVALVTSFNPTTDSDAIRQAYSFAAEKHKNQSRDEGTPYLWHLTRVAKILVEEADVADTEMICAALLHDVIEDQGITVEELNKRFGERVAKLVQQLTKPKELDELKGVAKDAQYGPLYWNAIQADSKALLLKVCDRLDNMRCIGEIHHSNPKKHREYIWRTVHQYLPVVREQVPKLKEAYKQIIAQETSVYHLDLDYLKIEAAQFALLPGDPGRVKEIAETPPFENSHEIANKREYRTWIGYINKNPVLATSTGIGGPSTSIVIDELAQLGVKTFLRVGTTGAIQTYINVGDVIITTGAVRLDGASTHYAPIEYPAVAHHNVVNALIEAARQLRIPYHVGITCSCDTFYPGQERRDSFSQYVPRRFQDITREWQKLNVLNYEMEAATVLTLCSALGLHSGCVTGVIVNRTKSERISKEDLVLGEMNAVKIAVKAMATLI